MFRNTAIYYLIFFCLPLFGQNSLSNAEYFWGTIDPGEGNGTPLLPIDKPVILFNDLIDENSNWSGDFGVEKGAWKLNSGETPTDNTGPSSGINNSSYFYFESGWQNSGNGTIIYKEEFKNQIGFGALYNSINTNGVDWNIIPNSANNTSNLLDANDYFKVVSGDYLQAQDVNTNAYWYSPLINIGNYSNVGISFNVWETGNLTNFDYVNCEYRVNGGSWTYFSDNGLKVGNFGNYIASSSNLNGSTLEVRVTVNVDDNAINFDNLEVYGQSTLNNGKIRSSIISPPIALSNLYDSANLTFNLSAFGTNSIAIPRELIINNSDDGFEYDGQNGTYATSASNMRLGNRSGSSSYGDTWAGLRFTTVPIPQGATISSANILVVAYNNSSSQVSLKIYAEAVDNSTTFSNADNNFRNRISTTAQVDWDINSNWVSGTTYSSVDISSIIQEIVNRPGWSINNSINIIIKDDGSNSGNHKNIYQNNGSNTYAPKLDVSYSIGNQTTGIDSLIVGVGNNLNSPFSEIYTNNSSSSSSSFNLISKDISSFIGDSIYLKFTCITDNTLNAHLGDIAIDNIRIEAKSDPGLYNEVIEYLTKKNGPNPSNDSLVVLNLRAKDMYGNWGPLYKRIFLNYNSSNGLRDVKITKAEYFWDTDPGQGSANALQVLDGNYNEVIETIYKNNLTYPNTNGLHQLAIRIKDENNNWGPTYKRAVYVSNIQDVKITSAEFFFGTTDPGEGSGTTMLIMDGNYNEALESVLKSSVNVDTGFNLLNVRVRDLSDNWGPVFKRTIYKNDSSYLRDMQLTQAEFFWGNSDPGQGSANTMLVFDGNYDEAFEVVLSNNSTSPPNDSLNLLNVRIKDENNNWGSLYKRVLLQYDSASAIRNLKISNAEYFWDIDPGQGSGTSMLVLDGNYNEAIESIYKQNSALSFGFHSFGVRIQDESGVWGPTFRRSMYVNANPQDIKISSAEFFFGNSDPGEGSGTALIVMDGNYNEAIESVLKSSLSLDTGFNLLNVRVKDLDNNWGPLFKKTIFRNDSSDLRDMKLTQAEFFWGTTDPGLGNANTLLAFDGNYEEALETLLANSASSPLSDSLNLLNLRIKDESNNWGALYKRVFLQYDSATALRKIKLTQAEYYWDIDPGLGNATPLLVLDGQFDEAIETVYKSVNTTSYGNHVFGIRVKSEEGNWGSTFKRTVFVNSLPQDIKITNAEYFFGTTDPGAGNAEALIVFDGQFDEALEAINKNTLSLDTGFNLINLRVRDLNDNWGPLFKKVIYKNDSSLLRDIKITAAEYFWGTSDPGQGSATTLLAFDGDFNEAFEVVFNDNTTSPNNDSLNLFNIRIKDENNNWGSLYKRVFLQYDSSFALRILKLTSAEYFWDIDPGQGSGTPLLVFDGNYDEVIETIYSDSITFPDSTGLHVLGIRTKDEKGVWSPVYKRTVNVDDPQDIKITAAEYFWGISDPGAGSGISMIVFDGNFNEALEQITQNNLVPDTGMNLLNLRVRDLSNDWGPVFKRAIYKNDSSFLEDIKIKSGEFFWDTIDPGLGNATTLLAFDGDFNEAFEVVFTDSASSPPNDSLNLFNIRVKDYAGNWGALYKRVFLQYDSANAIRDLKITSGEYFWDTDPGFGNGGALLVLDGNYNEAMENMYSNNTLNNIDTGWHQFGLRIRDESSIWGPTYYRSILVKLSPQLIKITSAEFFFGSTDPGEGSGTTLLVMDGQFDEALENVMKASLQVDTGFSLLNVRIKDLNNDWGPVFKRVIYKNDSSYLEDIKITSGEFFWDTIDPGLGNATTLLAFDGDFNEALELVISDSATAPPNDSLNLLNIRVMDENGNWGALFKRVFLQYDSANALEDLKVTSAEYFWDTDPGSGNGAVLLVFDGNYNEAIENMYSNNAFNNISSGWHQFGLRIRDESSIWGPTYYRSILVTDVPQLIKITAGEFFWGPTDPGLGNGIPILSFDGGFDRELEMLLTTDLFSPGGDTTLFNLRVKDEELNWGPLYRRTIINNLPQYQLEIINLGSSDTICFGDSIVLKANGSENFRWLNTSIVNNDTLNEVKAFPEQTSQMMVVGSNYYSGTDTAYYTIYVEQLPDLSISYSKDSICLGESVTFNASGTDNYNWNNGVETSSNTITPIYDSSLYLTGISNFGCINYDTVFITVNNPTSSPTIFDTTCNSYFLNGETFTTSGLYQQTLVNNKGCDSTVTLDLQVNYSNSEIIPITACDSFMYYNTKYETSGLYTHYYINRFGCDSVESIDLTVNYTTHDTLDVTACESYFINNYNYYSSGTYHQTLLNTIGCDSLLTINLSLIYNSYGSDVQSVCDTFISPNGSIFTNSGNYVYSLPNSIGCDSMVTLSLDVKNSTYGTDYQTSCNSFTWMDGQNYNSSTNAPIYNLTNSVGCDSIVNLDLIIINDVNTSNSISVCDSFIDPNGQVYDSSGIYSYVLPASNGCDSVVSLDLDIQKSFSFLQDTVCSGPYQLNWVTYYSSGTYQQTIQNTVGCDSVITLNLIVQEDLGLSFTANQQVFLNPAFDVEFYNNSNNINQMNFTWDFGDGTSLQTNNSLVNHTYNFNGFYDVKLLATYNSTGCSDSLFSSEYILCMGGEDDTLSSIENYNPDVKLYPNPTNGRIYIDIGNYQKEFTVEVYDIAGKLILISSAQNIDISKHERGTYLFKINYANRSKTIRVVKH